MPRSWPRPRQASRPPQSASDRTSDRDRKPLPDLDPYGRGIHRQRQRDRSSPSSTDARSLRLHRSDPRLRPYLIGNPSSYVGFRTSTMTEIEFLSELVRRTGRRLLCDVSNVYLSAQWATAPTPITTACPPLPRTSSAGSRLRLLASPNTARVSQSSFLARRPGAERVPTSGGLPASDASWTSGIAPRRASTARGKARRFRVVRSSRTRSLPIVTEASVAARP
ncbi:DUF692 family protein [Microvirga makkahensis]|uniref:DUF692 family protein n=1 Tax=Microvirga makkahensis TaxID=1128670 RepID=A0A7X3MVN6_9HYPH|nr:DUF692 family protein [Microvirga makkahensis]